MAAIDFPASPTLNQVFASTNGVNYQWNGTMWLSVGPTSLTTPGGDFSAVQTSGFVNPYPSATLIFNQIASGNSGGWLNTTNGRYTPPAGRYYIAASMSGYNNAATIFTLSLRKNGASLLTDYATTSAGGTYADVDVSGTFEANGTDWFDVLGASSTSNQNAFASQTFTAFPISGIKGPPGEVGSIGQRISCTFGIGSIPVAVTVGLGWTVIANDTGSNPAGGVGGTWTPPAGRWAISGTMSFNNVSAGTGYVRLIPTKNGAATRTLHAFSFQSGEILIIDYNDVVDFNGTETFEWQAYVDMATNTFDPSSWWTAHRIR